MTDHEQASPSFESPTFELLLKVFLPFAGGYYLSYLYRTVNAIISPDLVREFSLGPGDLGLLTSSYFLTFALFQLPLGILLDRYGPRRVNAGLLMLAMRQPETPSPISARATINPPRLWLSANKAAPVPASINRPAFTRRGP